jgi:hypothetical protein
MAGGVANAVFISGCTDRKRFGGLLNKECDYHRKNHQDTDHTKYNLLYAQLALMLG